jgi:hypothetical protein
MKFSVGLNFDESVITEIFIDEEMTMEIFSENVSIKKVSAVLDENYKFSFEIVDTLKDLTEYEFVLELPGKVGGYLPYSTTDVFTYSDKDQDYGNISDIILANKTITSLEIQSSKKVLSDLRDEVQLITDSYKDKIKYYENLIKYSITSEMLVDQVTGREVTQISGEDGLIERTYLFLKDSVEPAMDHYGSISRQYYSLYKDLSYTINQILQDFPEEVKNIESRLNK